MKSDDDKSQDNDDAEPVNLGSDQGKANSELVVEAEKWKNDFLYLRAELDNIKKNHLKERSELLKFGSERLVVALLEVVDNFERALQTPFTPENAENLRAGFELIGKDLVSCLDRFGVRAENPEGMPFDPTSHEALGSEPSESVIEGHIVRVFKKPYKMHEKLIRPAQVVIATKPKPKAE